MDFAGSTVVHLIGATGAFAALLLLGPRIGKYTKDGKPRAIPGHSMPLVGLGVLILWLGWFGFNPGSTLGAIGGRFAKWSSDHPPRRRRRGDRGGRGHVPEVENDRHRHGRQRRDRRPGRRSPPRPAYVEYWAAPIIGADRRRASSSSRVLAIDKMIDDPVGALSAHGLAGIWGTLACRHLRLAAAGDLTKSPDPGLWYSGLR